MSSCPKECGPRGDVISTPEIEEPADLAPKFHCSCLESAAKPDAGGEVVNVTTSGKSSEQELENTLCESPKQEAEGENTKPEEDGRRKETKENSKPEEDKVEEEKAEDDGSKQKRKEIEHSSLFHIADATSDRVKIVPDALHDPIIEKLAQGAKLRSLKLSSTNKSPREDALKQATFQELYDDGDGASS